MLSTIENGTYWHLSSTFTEAPPSCTWQVSCCGSDGVMSVLRTSLKLNMTHAPPHRHKTKNESRLWFTSESHKSNNMFTSILIKLYDFNNVDMFLQQHSRLFLLLTRFLPEKSMTWCCSCIHNNELYNGRYPVVYFYTIQCTTAEACHHVHVIKCIVSCSWYYRTQH